MSERNKLPDFGDVSREIKDILNNAQPYAETVINGLQHAAAINKQRIERSVNYASSIATVAKDLGSTAITNLLRRSTELGDRPDGDED